jgi:acyl-CoA thioester hydrolase
MEEGRSEFMRQKGLDYVAVERSGLSLAVTDVNVRYLAPAHYNERVTVRTWIDSLRSRALTFGYEVINADTCQRLVTGSVKLMLINRQGQVVALPATFQATLLY